ncbi:MAG TPA: hypothetical protein IAB22_08285 [Candidatus Merdivicinus intestinavium]|nr:hypothetical protein [Candidatus Merdivicinus intestinavium]
MRWKPLGIFREAGRKRGRFPPFGGKKVKRAKTGRKEKKAGFSGIAKARVFTVCKNPVEFTGFPHFPHTYQHLSL